jgi:hypothetical protein
MVIVGMVIVMIIPMSMAIALGPRLGRSSGDAAEHPDSAIAEGLKR